MDFSIAESVVETVHFLQYSHTRASNRSYANEFSSVITNLRRLKNTVTHEEVERILTHIQPILESAKQINTVDKGHLSYFSGNMNGSRDFDIKYQKEFLIRCDLPMMKNFLNDYISDLKLAAVNKEKKDMEFSLRNLEVFIGEYLEFPEDKELNEKLSDDFIEIVETR